jgi:secreted Zn-dependent insulinase-like peptidase
MDATVYRFDVNSTHFPEALDIFSQFFKHPLFSPESASREIKAVDAEDSKNRQLDGRRTLQILKCLMNPSHPYSKFSTGNITTLAKGDPEGNAHLLREEMKTFYRTFYLSRSMGLAVAGPQPLTELEALAKEHFSNILHNPTAKPPPSSEFPAGCLQQGQEVFINPVREIHDLSVIWVLPSLRSVLWPDSNLVTSLGLSIAQTLLASCRSSLATRERAASSPTSRSPPPPTCESRSPSSRSKAGRRHCLLELEPPSMTFRCFR